MSVTSVNLDELYTTLWLKAAAALVESGVKNGLLEEIAPGYLSTSEKLAAFVKSIGSPYHLAVIVSTQPIHLTPINVPDAPESPSPA